jgi:hypothetical protein
LHSFLRHLWHNSDTLNALSTFQLMYDLFAALRDP